MTTSKKSGRALPLLCNLIGIVILLGVLAICLPLTVPRLAGYEIYNVESGSMEPAIPAGSVVYVWPAEPSEVRPDEVIAFTREGSPIVHRVTENWTVEGEFVTKGDANPIEDVATVPYSALIGRVTYHMPFLGGFLALLTGTVGKVYMIIFAACGVMFQILAARIRIRRRNKNRVADIAYEDYIRSGGREEGAAAAGERAGSRPSRGSRVRTVLMVFFGAVFLIAAAGVAAILLQYHYSGQLYRDAAAQYTRPQSEAAEAGAGAAAADPSVRRVMAPIEVDFDALRAVNEEVVGWIYCEDTVINYPVLQAAYSNKYLRHTYDGNYNIAGSIFVEGNNRRDFEDANTIIYGHHMQDGSMFASLDKWADQEYYDRHPQMWMLTPERDYRIVLFTGYHTSAYADTYRIYQEYDEDFEKYLQEAIDRSDFQADLSQIFRTAETPEGTEVTLDQTGHYVLLSTCAYIFDNARYVLHGILVPADSAGGRPLKPETGDSIS